MAYGCYGECQSGLEEETGLFYLLQLYYTPASHLGSIWRQCLADDENFNLVSARKICIVESGIQTHDIPWQLLQTPLCSIQSTYNATPHPPPSPPRVPLVPHPRHLAPLPPHTHLPRPHPPRTTIPRSPHPQKTPPQNRRPRLRPANPPLAQHLRPGPSTSPDSADQAALLAQGVSTAAESAVAVGVAGESFEDCARADTVVHPVLDISFFGSTIRLGVGADGA